MAHVDMKYVSFVHWGQGQHTTMELHHENGLVKVGEGPLHGSWTQDPTNANIHINWHCRGEEENVKLHTYRRLPRDVNVWELDTREGKVVPCTGHLWRCLLMMTCTQPFSLLQPPPCTAFDHGETFILALCVTSGAVAEAAVFFASPLAAGPYRRTLPPPDDGIISYES